MISWEQTTLFLAVICASVMGTSANDKDFKNSARERRFISFDSDGGKIDIDLDLSVPFLSIPLDNEAGSDGSRRPLLNVNTKAITAAGLMAALTAFIVPLFFKTPSDHRYRLDDEFGFMQMGNTVNDFIFGNNHVTPCIQRAVCTVVAKISKTDNPTSSDKIIDGITSNRWFKEVTNGTSIQEAIAKGRDQNIDCSFVYDRCPVPPKIFNKLFEQFGYF